MKKCELDCNGHGKCVVRIYIKNKIRMVNVNVFFLLLDLLVILIYAQTFAVDMENVLKMDVYVILDGEVQIALSNTVIKIVMDMGNVMFIQESVSVIKVMLEIIVNYLLVPIIVLDMEYVKIFNVYVMKDGKDLIAV